jgi:hypothetical protein
MLATDTRTAVEPCPCSARCAVRYPPLFYTRVGASFALGGVFGALACGCPAELPPAPPLANPAATTAELQSQGPAVWKEIVRQTAAAQLARIEFAAPLDAADLHVLANCRTLREIVLPQAHCDAAAWKVLTQLPALETLRLGSTTLDDAALCSSAQLPSPEPLPCACGDLHGNHVVWPLLRSLNLAESAIGDNGLALLARHPRLELLRLGSSRITDQGLAHLANCKNLKYLILTHARIRGPGLQSLHYLERLESLYLAGNEIDDSNRAALQAALPDLHPDW